MTVVEFIKLEKAEKARHCCLLADKYFNAGKRVLITVQDQDQGHALDKFMWSWRKMAFIPHVFLEDEEEQADEAVIITTDKSRHHKAAVLIMASPCQIEFVRRFEYVYDFAETYDSALHEEARRRFVRYKREGFETRMHQ